ncbi:conserved hypothetical protein [Ricinus communis]|uniref:Uncharacterized protein n=1 Tax=Ricinus communis TaxID=3988 RepID=B9SPX6_RICCO|nr:conserved hypothetical protein [Ricinus communis]
MAGVDSMKCQIKYEEHEGWCAGLRDESIGLLGQRWISLGPLGLQGMVPDAYLLGCSIQLAGPSNEGCFAAMSPMVRQRCVAPLAGHDIKLRLNLGVIRLEK